MTEEVSGSPSAPDPLARADAPQPGSTAALYLELVSVHGQCVCNEVSCYGDVDWLSEDGCLLCHVLDPEWPCPAEEDADYPEVRP